MSGAMAGAVTPRRPDQGDPGPSTGLGGGFRSGILRARLVIVSGANGGVFVYSNTAAAGNLVASMVAGATTDSAGNEILADVTDYARAGSPIQAVQLTSGTILFSTAASQAGPYLGRATIEWDTVNNQLLISPGGLPIALNGPLVSTAGNIQVVEGNWVFNPGFTVAASDPNNPGTADPWHAVQLDGTWTAGNPAPSYRLLPDGNLQLTGLATHAAITTETALNSGTPLVAPYVPATNKNYQGNRAGGTAGAEIKSTGVIFAEPNGVSSTSVDITGIVPLNL